MIDLKIDEFNTCSFMASVLENMQDMVRIIDQNDMVIFMNKRMREEFGDYVGVKCYEMFNKREECINCTSKQCITDCVARGKEQMIGECCFSVISSPVFNTDSNQWMSVEVLRDITEEKKMEKLVLDNYNKMIKDLTYAKQMQEQILPQNNIYGNAIELHSKYIPSEQLSGDVYDIFEIDEYKIGIYMADVSGHGVMASMFTMFLRQAIRSKKYKDLSIKEMINHLINEYKELDLNTDQYFTILYGVYDRSEKKLSLVNAGHNSLPILIKENGNIEELCVKGMPVCSILDSFSHETIEVNIGPGDKLILYTDGLTERYNEEDDAFFGTEKLLEICNDHIDIKSDELIELFVSKAISFSNDEIKDDIAVAVFDFIK